MSFQSDQIHAAKVTVERVGATIKVTRHDTRPPEKIHIPVNCADDVAAALSELPE